MGIGRRHFDGERVALSEIDARVYGRLWKEVKPYTWYIVAAIGIMVVVSLSGLTGPYLMKIAIDDYISQGNAAGLNIIALAYLALYLVNWAATYGQIYLVSWVGQNIIYSVRKRLFEHLQTLSFRFYDSIEAGRVISRVTNDVDALNELVSSGLVTAFSDMFTVVAIMGIMIYINAPLALASFVTIPLLLLLTIVLRGRMRTAYHKVRRRIADVNANLQESISGVKVVQSFNREDENMERFSETNTRNMQANLEAAALFSLFWPAVTVIGAVGTAVVLWYGGMRISQGALTIGGLVAFTGYVTRFFHPINSLSQLYNVLQSGIVSAQRIFEFLDEEPDVADGPEALELGDIAGAIQYSQVTFGYDADEPVLHDINIQCRPGETVALVGPTGAGKSSIINLLARFYDPQRGKVLIDGQDLTAVILNSLRSQLGIVLQDTFIFSGTIEDNIRYGKLEATEDEIVAAAQAVNAHGFISRLPEGYRTEVGERGALLSVGQRQLISFARALISDPRILILDEATSSVDAYTEMLIQQALELLLEGRTAFVIAHRLSTVRNADKIYVVDQGQIAEAGTHEELVASGGKYAELYRKQWSTLEE